MTDSKLAFLLDAAKQAGATAADCMELVSDGVSLSIRNGKVDQLERDENFDLGLRVFVDGRIASVSTNRSDNETLRTLAERAVAMAKIAPADPFAGLHPADQLAGNVSSRIKELDLYDDFEPDTESLIDRALRAEAAALENTKVSGTDSVGTGWGKSRVAIATSNGFYGTYKGSSHSLSVVVLGGEGQNMQRDYDYSSARHFADLEEPEVIGASAATRTVGRLNPVKKSTANIPVVFDKRVSGSLIAGVAGAINGSSVARGSSFLKEKLGQPILAKGLTLTDNPLMVRGLGSKPFDGEGHETQARDFVVDGVLQSWVLDLATANQLGLASTGNASRGVTGSPGPSMTNFYLHAGHQSVEEMIGDIEEGFLITEMMGHGLSMTTGDYSRGAGGFWIRNGQICEAVNEMTVAGQMQDMLMSMEPANDLDFKSSLNAPSIRVEGMTVAGK